MSWHRLIHKHYRRHNKMLNNKCMQAQETICSRMCSFIFRPFKLKTTITFPDIHFGVFFGRMLCRTIPWFFLVEQDFSLTSLTYTQRVQGWSWNGFSWGGYKPNTPQPTITFIVRVFHIVMTFLLNFQLYESL